MMKAKKLLVAMAAVAVPYLGNAATVSYMVPFNSVPPTAAGAYSVPLPLYSGSETLVKVTLDIVGTFGGSFLTQNTSTATASYTLKWDPWAAAADTGLGGSPILSATGNAAVVASNPALLAGASTTWGSPYSEAYAASDFTTVGAEMAQFVGVGNFSVEITDATPWIVTGTAPAQNLASGFTNTGEVMVTYETVPEPQTYALLAGLGMIGFVAIRRRLR